MTQGTHWNMKYLLFQGLLTLCLKSTVFRVLQIAPVPLLCTDWVFIKTVLLNVFTITLVQTVLPVLNCKDPRADKQWPTLLYKSKSKLQTCQEPDRHYDDAKEHRGCSVTDF